MDELPARYKIEWLPVSTPLALECWIRWDRPDDADDGPFPVLMFLLKTMSLEADAQRARMVRERPGERAVVWYEFREPDEFAYSAEDEWEYASKAVVLAVPPTWEMDTFLLRGGSDYEVWWTEPPPKEKKEA